MCHSILKRSITWLLIVIAVVGVYVSYRGIYILLAYFATGLPPWINLALGTSGTAWPRHCRLRLGEAAPENRDGAGIVCIWSVASFVDIDVDRFRLPAPPDNNTLDRSGGSAFLK